MIINQYKLVSDKTQFVIVNKVPPCFKIDKDGRILLTRQMVRIYFLISNLTVCNFQESQSYKIEIMASLGRFVKIHTLFIKVLDPKLFPKIKYTPKEHIIEDKPVPLELGKFEVKEPTDLAIIDSKDEEIEEIEEPAPYKEEEEEEEEDDGIIKYKIVYDNDQNIFEIDEDLGVLKLISKPPNCTGKPKNITCM